MKIGALLLAGLGLLVVAFLIALVALKIAWGWVIPDIFPQAVATDLIVQELTWAQAAKLAILLSIVSTFLKTGTSSSK